MPNSEIMPWRAHNFTRKYTSLQPVNCTIPGCLSSVGLRKRTKRILIFTDLAYSLKTIDRTHVASAFTCEFPNLLHPSMTKILNAVIKAHVHVPLLVQSYETVRGIGGAVGPGLS